MKLSVHFALLLLALLLADPLIAAPPLPPGLKQQKPELPAGLSAPALPAGLRQETASPESDKAPALPEGLNTGESNSDGFDQDNQMHEPFINITGFWDIRGGIRTQNDPHQDDFSLGETRLHLDLQKEVGSVNINLISDFIYDSQAQNHHIDLQTGQGWIDLRAANIAFSPLDFVDIKLGRQILTWGTGDLIFINDLFPKDWQAFFIGRDVEYLKAPSDAVKLALFSGVANLDIIFTPQFDADRSITGERISYFSPVSGQPAGNNAVISSQTPNAPEWSLRLYQTIGISELAIYGYYGYWKSPAGIHPSTAQAIHPALSVIGGSVRRPLYKGIANFEMGYYLSADDPHGNKANIQNSEARFLLGYEQEVLKNFSVGLQYYLEWLQDYDNYLGSLPSGAVKRDELRHVISNRLTWLTLNQNLTLSLFTFFSPSDLDAYLRPKIHYKITDAWSTELGGNFFIGEKNHTFFGQFADNNNVYAAVRFGF